METEEKTGTEVEGTTDSLGAAVDAAVARDTRETEAHTPATRDAAPRDIDSLLAEVEARRAEIPAERLASLNPQMQAGFTKKMNFLRDATERLQQGLTQQGIELPEGKTMMDLLTEDDGKGFVKVLGDLQQRNLAPVTEFISKQETERRVQEMSALAQREFPELQDRATFEAASRLIVENPDYMKIAAMDNWGALPVVLNAASTFLKAEKLAKENAEMKKLLEANKVVQKTGASTTRAGGPSSDRRSGGAKTIDDAVDQAFKRAAAELS